MARCVSVAALIATDAGRSLRRHWAVRNGGTRPRSGRLSPGKKTINTSRVLTLVLSAFAFSLAAGSAVAQTGNSHPVNRVYIVTVPPHQDYAFNEGVKAWEKCLGQHGYARQIATYDAETGDLTRYAFLLPWSEHGRERPRRFEPFAQRPRMPVNSRLHAQRRRVRDGMLVQCCP